MNWQAFWDRQAEQKDPQSQVGRVRGGVPVAPDDLKRIAAYLAGLLDLQPQDTLLDVCCGNGWLTQKLAGSCQKVLGVDLSPKQIDLARSRNKYAHVQYRVGDATRLTESVQEKFDKVSLYFSFQYLERIKDGRAAIAGMLSLLKPGGRIVIGDVPDHRYLSKFYPGTSKRLRYYLRLYTGKSDMGKFWKEAEINRICRQYGANYERREQPAFLPYSQYRADYIISLTES